MKQKQANTYFDAASDWAVERVETLQVTACRWQAAFWGMVVCLLIALVAIMAITPLKTVEPIIIQKDLQTGEVFVKPGEPANLTKSIQETESDLTRYVMARETYSLVDEEVRYRQVQYMSSPDVFQPYVEERRSTNESSFEALLGEKGLRTVSVEDVVFLDASAPSLGPKKRALIQPIAKVDFITTETAHQQVIKKYWVATIKFTYFGTPDTKEAAWANWDGFTVTSYRVDARNH